MESGRTVSVVAPPPRVPPGWCAPRGCPGLRRSVVSEGDVCASGSDHLEEEGSGGEGRGDPPSGATAPTQARGGEADERREAARGVSPVRRRSSIDPTRGDPLVGGPPRRLSSAEATGRMVGEAVARSSPDRTVEGLRCRANRQGAAASEAAAVHLRRGAWGPLAQQRGRDPGPPGGAVPEDPRWPTLVDAGVGPRATVDGRSNVSEARGRFPRRGGEGAPGECLPRIRPSVTLFRKLSAYASKKPPFGRVDFGGRDAHTCA